MCFGFFRKQRYRSPAGVSAKAFTGVDRCGGFVGFVFWREKHAKRTRTSAQPEDTGFQLEMPLGIQQCAVCVAGQGRVAPRSGGEGGNEKVTLDTPTVFVGVSRASRDGSID